MPNMVSTTSHSHSTSTQVPVLIVGAGPTGLFAALLLTKMGIPCRLIDRQHEPSKLSKALVIHARTLEIFQMVGRSDVKDEDTLLGKFMSEGSQLAEFYIYFGKKLTSIVPALRNTESRFNYGLFLEQAKTVEILTEELTKAGMHVERGWELMDTKVVEMDGASKSYVETTIRRAKVGTNIRANESKIMGAVELEEDQEGKEYDVEVVRSEYLIAADGGKSAVRHKLNISFKGRTLDNNMILYDGRVKADIPLDKITLIHGDCGRSIMVVPLSNGRVRIMLNNGTLTPEEHQAQKSEELTLSAFQEMVDTTVAPVKVELLDCDWLTYYRVNERLADRYSEKGRIFLSGDAAHVHSPAGGQGMNMGLQDTFNLTWKMALVLKGSASASILDTYEAERLKVAEDIIQLSSNIFGNGMADDFFHRMFKKFVLMALPYILPRVPHGPPMCMVN
ncbi:FAD-binding monooxygenase [Dissophora ornata]|nr:FAD-binding monooxygenase [Dissophora ornata]